MPNVKKKVPQESASYPADSEFLMAQIAAIMQDCIDRKDNRIFIFTNLKNGLPLENINKVAGPFVEAWAQEKFEEIVSDPANKWRLIHVERGKRLAPYDIILQFKKVQNGTEYASGNVDVKATASDIETAGKSPNITSYARIRNEYLDDPDYVFIILSLKHRVFCEQEQEKGITRGIMEVVSQNCYDLKYVGASDLSYNPALGTGQLQLRDIHYVEIQKRTAAEFIEMLDQKFVRSKGEDAWIALARKHQWIKEE